MVKRITVVPGDWTPPRTREEYLAQRDVEREDRDAWVEQKKINRRPAYGKIKNMKLNRG